MPSSESKAPAIFKLSSTFLLTACKLTEEVKSKILLKFLCSFLASTIFSKAFIPTFLIAFKPNDMVLLSMGLKFISDMLMSGGLTSISIFRHSLIKITILSMFDISLVKFALINSAG